jgi:cell division protein FtsI (penicillin-binding protein 3)
LDSPDGPYPRDGGGEAAAPVFQRIAQQILAYLNVPHDVELQDPRRMWIRAHAKEDEVSEGARDYIAGAQASVDTAAPEQPTAPSAPVAEQPLVQPVAASARPAALPVKPPSVPAKASTVPATTVQPVSLKAPEPPRGTLVLDVAGGVLVPDFHGKSLRSALEEAESAGLELEISGSGVGLTQSPAAGSRIPPGAHVSVTFGR